MWIFILDPSLVTPYLMCMKPPMKPHWDWPKQHPRYIWLFATAVVWLCKNIIFNISFAKLCHSARLPSLFTFHFLFLLLFGMHNYWTAPTSFLFFLLLAQQKWGKDTSPLFDVDWVHTEASLPLLVAASGVPWLTSQDGEASCKLKPRAKRWGRPPRRLRTSTMAAVTPLPQQHASD